MVPNVLSVLYCNVQALYYHGEGSSFHERKKNNSPVVFFHKQVLTNKINISEKYLKS